MTNHGHAFFSVQWGDDVIAFTRCKRLHGQLATLENMPLIPLTKEAARLLEHVCGSERRLRVRATAVSGTWRVSDVQIRNYVGEWAASGDDVIMLTRFVNQDVGEDFAIGEVTLSLLIDSANDTTAARLERMLLPDVALDAPQPVDPAEILQLLADAVAPDPEIGMSSLVEFLQIADSRRGPVMVERF